MPKWCASLALSVAFTATAAGCTQTHDRTEQDKAEFHYKLANNAFYAHDPMEAIQELYKAIELDPNHKLAHHLLGFIYFGRREFPEAERQFKTALEIDGRFFDARTNLGALYLAQERWQDAIDTFLPLASERLYPTPHLLHNNLGWAYHHLRMWDKAESHYKLAIFLKPRMCLAHNNLGRLYYDTGRSELAVRSFDRAIERCADYQEPWYHLGRIYQESGQIGPAIESFDRCVELGPENPLGADCQALRDQLRGDR
jgi:Tfp pilus assembly protein PilF